MAEQAIILEIDTQEAKDFLDFAGYRAKNTGVPMRRAARALLESIDMTFATEGEWVGEFWPELSPRYRVWKEAHAPTYQGRTTMLHLTYPQPGSLRKRATSRNTIHIDTLDREGGIFEYILDEPSWAGVHQHGATWEQHGKEIHVPARPFLRVHHDLVDQWEEIFTDWLINKRDRTAKGDFASVPVPDFAGALGAFL